MDLENSQGVHNGIISSIGNASASYDPHQIPNDSTNTLIQGAEIAVAGNTLDMSEEEMLSFASRKARRQQQRDAFKSRHKKEAEWEQKQKTLRNEGFAPDLPDTDTIDGDAFTEEESVFGKTDYEMGLRNLDQDNEVYTEYDDYTGGRRVPRPEYEVRGTRTYKSGKQYPIGNRLRSQETDNFTQQQAPKSVFKDLLRRVEPIAQASGGTVGNTGVNVVDLVERLRANTQSDSGKDRERFLVEQMIAADAANSDPEMRQYNEYQAEAESQRIARDYFGGYGSGSMADEAIGRIAEIRKLGGAGVLTEGGPGDQAQVIRYEPEPDYTAPKIVNGVYIDPNTNNPIAIQGPEVPKAVQGANTPNTGQMANAPAPMTAATWLQANVPDYRQSDRVFGDYPQVDIALETSNFAQRLSELNGFGLEGLVNPETGAVRNIRSRDDLQKVSDFILAKAAKQGKKLYLKNPETGKNQRRPNPDIREVMQLARMTQMDQQKLANALFQMEQSNERPGYIDRTAGPTKDVIFDAAEMADENGMMTKLERIAKGATIKTKEGRREIRTLIEGLDGGPDVTKGEMGQERGTKPRIDRRKPKNMGSGDEMEARIRAQAEGRAARDRKPVNEERLRENIVKARLAEERAKRDDRIREKRKNSLFVSPQAAEDNAFIDQARGQRQTAAEAAEVAKLIELAAYGRRYPSPDFTSVPARRGGAEGQFVGQQPGDGRLSNIKSDDDPTFIRNVRFPRR